MGTGRGVEEVEEKEGEEGIDDGEGGGQDLSRVMMTVGTLS